MDLCGKSSGLADFENTVDRGSVVIFDAESRLCLSYVEISWVLNEIWIIDLSLALVGMLMSSSKLFIFSLKLRCETVIGIVLCYSHQACCLLHYLGEINSGIHIYQFAFEPFSDVIVVSDLNKNFGGSTDLAKKRHGSADLHTPFHPPLDHARTLRKKTLYI